MDVFVSNSLARPVWKYPLSSSFNLVLCSLALYKSLWAGVFATSYNDIMTPISHMCTRVQNLNEDGMKKFYRAIIYLRTTTDSAMERSNKHHILAYIDASFGVHVNYKSHTRVAILMEITLLLGRSTKQRLNTKSSTEVEIV